MKVKKFEEIWLEKIQRLRTSGRDRAAVFVTRLGNGGAVWVLIAVIMLAVPGYRAGGRGIILSLISSVFWGNLVLKNAVARERPCWKNPQVPLPIEVPADYSFPSGHTMASFAAATAIFDVNVWMGLAAFVLAAAIGFTRLYLYVHYPLDIIMGTALGIVVALPVCIFF
ncbi:phosphatase PAP2 family protein [Anaerolentibacter hominis]|uniref:phosphatase PAP2 family protein n=1 Tax=Anaerolentibacter hominis TaxID=3079009 RepID=UPI0031B86B7D